MPMAQKNDKRPANSSTLSPEAMAVFTYSLPSASVKASSSAAKESWGLLSSDCRANRPHLGLCPEANVPLQGRQGSRGCIPDAPGETGIHLEWKQRTPLCSRVATG